jgi:hypothetical protein
MRQDLERLRAIWEDCRASRNRDAIYAYLNAVYDLVAWWTADGHEIDRVRGALRLRRLEVSEREDPFAAVIRCTADPAKVNKRTRSKWSRVMRYAAAYKLDFEPLDKFIRSKGGMNACAGRFTRCLGQGTARSRMVVLLPHSASDKKRPWGSGDLAGNTVFKGHVAPRNCPQLERYRPSPSPKGAIPYLSAAPRQDLEGLRGVWEDCQASRHRNAIYPCPTAVYGLVI